MSTCPVCQENIHDDDPLLQAHVNSHFDAEPPKSRQDFFNGNARSAAPSPIIAPPREAECPICEYPLVLLTPDQAQTHVIACLGELGPPRDRS